MLSKVQELKLIARCVAFDDRDAFGVLVNEYHEPLSRFLYNLTGGNAALTDDLAQETFIKAWLGIKQFKGIAKFKTWLFKIACNEYASEKRKCHITADSLDLLDKAPQSFNESTEAKLDAHWLLSNLTGKERTVALLFYLEEMPIKKIVEITGFPEGTVKVYISRARTRMKELYLQDNYERKK